MTARWLILWCLVVLAAPGAGRAAGYDYPFADPYAATAIGTPSAYEADLPENVPLEEHELTVFPDRRIPRIFWYTKGLRFGLLPQPHKAPLAFVIGGTGADYNSSKSLILIRMFQKIGFHVISVPSPIHMNFIVNASTTNSTPSASSGCCWSTRRSTWRPRPTFSMPCSTITRRRASATS